MKKLSSFLLTFTTILFVFSPPVLAWNIADYFGQGTFNSGTVNQFQTLSQIFNPIILNLFVIAGIVVIATIVYGGFLYLMGSGQKDPKQMDQAKKAITYGLLGLTVMAASYWIIRIVEIFTGLDILNAGGV